MVEPIEFKFNSRSILWCRYYPDSSELQVRFISGTTYRYIDVPRKIVDALITAPSIGRFFYRYIAHAYKYNSIISTELPPQQSRGTALDLFQSSINAISPHVPPGWDETLHKLLANIPVLVRVVSPRKSKHGDQKTIKSRGFSVITVNDSGNPYNFVITLLHEIGHAIVRNKYEEKISPHGSEWKDTVRILLMERINLFPNNLRYAVVEYAGNPNYSTSPLLSLALRQYDEIDHRSTVAELPFGQAFSLDGKTVLIKNAMIRKWFKCSTPEGKIFRVSPTARVNSILPKKQKN